MQSITYRAAASMRQTKALSIFFFLFCCFVFGGGKKNIANSQETEFNHGSWLLLQSIFFLAMAMTYKSKTEM